MTRRGALALLFGVLVADRTAQAATRDANSSEAIVMIDGWVLRADDLARAAAHAV